MPRRLSSAIDWKALLRPMIWLPPDTQLVAALRQEPTPSVAMTELIPTTVTSAPLMAPIAVHAATASTTAAQTGKPWSPIIHATRIEPKPTLYANDRSNAPAANGSTSPTATMPVIACSDRIVVNVLVRRKVSGT